MEKSPIDSLTEWQDVIHYISKNIKQELLTPENNLSVRLEWERDVLFNRVLLRAGFNLNGIFRSVETELSLSSLIPEVIRANMIEGVKELSQEICREVTKDLEIQMMKKVLETTYTPHPFTP